MTPPAKPRSALFWILLALGLGGGGCCFLSVAVLALGALADDSTGATAGAPAAPGARAGATSGSVWQSAREVGRGSSVSQPLPGGRWVAQYGSTVDTTVARSGTTQWVQTNTSGSLYELTFDEDGTYVWRWVAAVTLYGQTSRSNCTEKGRWSLSGTRLTMEPESQAAEYSNQSNTQEKSDMDLSARSYQVLDLTMETLESAGEARRQFPALVMSGPKAAWDTGSGGGVTLTLQRLEN